MSLSFTKFEALGNDFALFDARREPGLFRSLAPIARSLCDRKRGIGADGLLFVQPGDRADCMMRLLNADGSESEMCGNGLRCIGLFLHEEGGAGPFAVQTLAGLTRIEYAGEKGGREQFRVEMGAPVLKASLVPTSLGNERAIEQPLATPLGEMRFTCVSMGNPHAVAFVDDPESLDLTEIGRHIENHPAFPRRTNVEFARVIGPGKVRVRVWERGCGETEACGSGACAVAVAANLTARVVGDAEIVLNGGSLFIEWAGEGHPVYMTGPARRVFNGSINKGDFSATRRKA